MKDNEAFEAVREIRVMMEKSSRFLSFSGTSVALIGVYALAGAFVVHSIISSVRERIVGRDRWQFGEPYPGRWKVWTISL